MKLFRVVEKQWLTVVVLIVLAVVTLQITKPALTRAEIYQPISKCDLADVRTGTPYYKTCAQPACSSSSGTGSVTLTGSDTAQKVFNYFTSIGLPAFQAAGILGNMQAESGVQPQRLQGTPSGAITTADQAEGNRLGWGLVQWTPAGKMITPTKAAGKDPNDLVVQLDFLWESLTTGNEKRAGDLFRATTNVDDASRVFLQDFERARDRYLPAEIQKRQSFSQQMLKQYGDGAPSGVTTVSTGCKTGDQASDDGGGVATVEGFTFPLKTTKGTLVGHNPQWCYTSQNNCHHDYNAADIFAPTGTVIVAPASGKVIKLAYTAGRGWRVTIKGDAGDGRLYFHNHMGRSNWNGQGANECSGEAGGSPAEFGITLDGHVNAGQPIGRVGTNCDAEGTPSHLHIDVLPASYEFHPSCPCTNDQGYENIQPALTKAFEKLPQ